MNKKRKAIPKRGGRRAAPRVTRAVSQSPEVVTWALHGIQQAIAEAKARVVELEAQERLLRAQARGAVAAASGSTTESAPQDAAAAPGPRRRARRKRTLSEDARRRIAEAQKRRWAKVRAAKAKA